MAKTLDEQYVVDRRGKPIQVLLDIDVYRKILEDVEELDVIRAYDTAKASNDEAIPFQTAIAEIEQARK